MGAKPGMDNAKKWRSDKIAVRKRLVDDALDKIRKRNIKIESEKELVDLLVKFTGLHRTTFTRTGSKYRENIIYFLNEQSGAAGSLNINAMNIETLRIHAKTKELEVEELKKAIGKLKRKVNEHVEVDNLGSETDLVDTIMALMLVIERDSCFAELDFQSQQIVDTTKDEDDPDRVIAKGARVAPLFKLIKANPVLCGMPVEAVTQLEADDG